MSYIREGERPEIAVGHVSLACADVPAATDFFIKLGIRPIVTKDAFAVLELRGGTHLVLRQGEIEAGSQIPFDVMVDDIDAAAGAYRERGLEPGPITRGRIHDGFTLPSPDDRVLSVTSSHAGNRPV